VNKTFNWKLISFLLYDGLRYKIYNAFYMQIKTVINIKLLKITVCIFVNRSAAQNGMILRMTHSTWLLGIRVTIYYKKILGYAENSFQKHYQLGLVV